MNPEAAFITASRDNLQSYFGKLEQSVSSELQKGKLAVLARSEVRAAAALQMASAGGSSAEEDIVVEAARASAGSYNSPTTMWQHQQHDQYRDAAHQEHKQAASTSHTPQLPPIQHFEGQMQPQPMYAPVAINGQIAPPPPPPSHHHPPPPPPAQYHPAQYHYSNGLPPAMPSNGGVNGRYPLPPHVINAPRQKKDIKRRTKTGCLTCRKRRIKVSLRECTPCDMGLAR